MKRLASRSISFMRVTIVPLGQQHRLRHFIEAASALGHDDGHQLVLGHPLLPQGLMVHNAHADQRPRRPFGQAPELGPPKQHHGESTVEHEEGGCAQDPTSNRVVIPDDAVVYGVGHGVDADDNQPVVR